MIDPAYTPWLDHYGSVCKHMELPDRTLYNMVAYAAKDVMDSVACEFMGRKITYREFMGSVDRCAAGLYAKGIRAGDHVMICMPNCPQAVIAFYAVNRLDAVAVMVHPLSSKGELEYVVGYADCKIIITLDMFYPNFPPLKDCGMCQEFIVSSIADGLSAAKGFMYRHVVGRKDPKVPKGTEGVTLWKDFISNNCPEPPPSVNDVDAPAVILFTGGTTGRMKGAVLSSNSFNCVALGMIELSQVLDDGDTMMAVMPIFHGFGLCACIHIPLIVGKKMILVPRFTPDSYAKLIVKDKPNFIAGVPTLYEHMIRSKWLQKADLSYLKGIFCGGDTLTVETKDRIDAFLKAHNCGTTVREGFGTTESVTANTINPKFEQKRGSVGVPMPNLYFKIVKPGTEERMPYGEDGEICVSGPALMLEYYKEPEETAHVKKVHAEDGMTWLHTGDIGYMDEDGYIFFKQRIKRVIITSGYNVYPSQVENVLNQLPFVQDVCVIGVPDELRGARIKAYIVLEKDAPSQEEVLSRIKEHVRENISKFAKPREYEFIPAMPRTKVGKIDYRKLEADAIGIEE